MTCTSGTSQGPILSMNNADLIVATLKAAGIGRGFGIPSGNVLPLMEAMRKGGVDFVLTAHEGSAGFAADVTGRMTGKPGLCIATLGPGATNLTTGVGNAWLDRSPLIAITCNLNTDQLGRRIQMWIDHHALFAPITKASFRLEKGKIAETVNEAIRIAMSEPRGPVHLDLPEDVALAPAREEPSATKPPSKLAQAPDSAIARAGAVDRQGQTAHRRARLIGHADGEAGAAAASDRAPQPAVRHDDDGQGHDRRGSSAFHRRDRALVPANPAQAPSLGRSDRRPRLRHGRSGVRSLDRGRAAAPGRYREGRCRPIGEGGA